jgi:hypothetical protein
MNGELLDYDVMFLDVVLKVKTPKGHSVPSAVYAPAAGNRLYITRYHSTEGVK